MTVLTSTTSPLTSADADNDQQQDHVAYYPDEDADADGPRVVSPRLRSLPKKVKCAREYAARLALLLHAQDCSKDQCSSPNCKIAKGVLAHVSKCKRQACHPSCRQAKILLRHHRQCAYRNRNRPCLVCNILRREFRPQSKLLKPLMSPKTLV